MTKKKDNKPLGKVVRVDKRMDQETGYVLRLIQDKNSLTSSGSGTVSAARDLIYDRPGPREDMVQKLTKCFSDLSEAETEERPLHCSTLVEKLRFGSQYFKNDLRFHLVATAANLLDAEEGKAMTKVGYAVFSEFFCEAIAKEPSEEKISQLTDRMMTLVYENQKVPYEEKLKNAGLHLDDADQKAIESLSSYVNDELEKKTQT